jgi:gluconokinase
MSQPVTPTSVRDPHQHHDRDLPPTPPYEPSSDLTKMSTRSTETTSLSRWSSAEPKYIWVITGPAGCGKTSVAQDIHQTFSLPYLEGDAVSWNGGLDVQPLPPKTTH